MHLEVMDFVRTALGANVWVYRLPRAVVHEIGSHNFNGSVRELFKWADSYTGVDFGPGDGVDIISPYHEAVPAGLPIPADIIVSTEALEHDPFWEKTLAAIAENLKPRGLAILTWAIPPRAPHFEGNSPKDYYKALDLLEIVQALGPHMDESFAAAERITATGLFWGRKAGEL